MVILVLNCGSSSIKYQVIDMEQTGSTLLAKGLSNASDSATASLPTNPSDERISSCTAPFPTTRPASAWYSTR